MEAWKFTKLTCPLLLNRDLWLIEFLELFYTLRIRTLKIIAGKQDFIFVFQVKMHYLMQNCAFYVAVLGKERCNCSHFI